MEAYWLTPSFLYPHRIHLISSSTASSNSSNSVQNNRIRLTRLASSSFTTSLTTHTPRSFAYSPPARTCLRLACVHHPWSCGSQHCQILLGCSHHSHHILRPVVTVSATLSGPEATVTAAPFLRSATIVAHNTVLHPLLDCASPCPYIHTSASYSRPPSIATTVARTSQNHRKILCPQ